MAARIIEEGFLVGEIDHHSTVAGAENRIDVGGVNLVPEGDSVSLRMSPRAVTDPAGTSSAPAATLENRRLNVI